MIKKLLITLSTVAGIAFSMTVSAEPPEREWTAEQQKVIDDVLSNGPIGMENDFERWLGGFSEDWSYWSPTDNEYRDRETHMARVRSYVGAGNRVTAYELEPVDIVIHGDIAVLRHTFTETILETTNEEIFVSGSSVTVLVKEEDGVWRKLQSNNVYHDEGDN